MSERSLIHLHGLHSLNQSITLSIQFVIEEYVLLLNKKSIHFRSLKTILYLNTFVIIAGSLLMISTISTVTSRKNTQMIIF
jgi:hypothetical protein